MGSVSSLFTFTPVANVTDDDDWAPLDGGWDGVVEAVAAAAAAAAAAGVDAAGGAAAAAAGDCQACREYDHRTG